MSNHSEPNNEVEKLLENLRTMPVSYSADDLSNLVNNASVPPRDSGFYLTLANVALCCVGLLLWWVIQPSQQSTVRMAHGGNHRVAPAEQTAEMTSRTLAAASGPRLRYGNVMLPAALADSMDAHTVNLDPEQFAALGMQVETPGFGMGMQVHASGFGYTERIANKSLHISVRQGTSGDLIYNVDTLAATDTSSPSMIAPVIITDKRRNRLKNWSANPAFRTVRKQDFTVSRSDYARNPRYYDAHNAGAMPEAMHWIVLDDKRMEQWKSHATAAMNEQDTIQDVSGLIPVQVKNTGNHDYVYWFKPTNDFMARLPEEYRQAVRNELAGSVTPQFTVPYQKNNGTLRDFGVTSDATQQGPILHISVVPTRGTVISVWITRTWHAATGGAPSIFQAQPGERNVFTIPVGAMESGVYDVVLSNTEDTSAVRVLIETDKRILKLPHQNVNVMLDTAQTRKFGFVMRNGMLEAPSGSIRLEDNNRNMFYNPVKGGSKINDLAIESIDMAHWIAVRIELPLDPALYSKCTYWYQATDELLQNLPPGYATDIRAERDNTRIPCRYLFNCEDVTDVIANVEISAPTDQKTMTLSFDLSKIQAFSVSLHGTDGRCLYHLGNVGALQQGKNIVSMPYPVFKKGVYDLVFRSAEGDEYTRKVLLYQ